MPGRGADPDGFDATTEGDRSRSQMAALELEPDTYALEYMYDDPDHDATDTAAAEYGEQERASLIMGGFGNGRGADGINDGTATQQRRRRGRTANGGGGGAFVGALLGSWSSLAAKAKTTPAPSTPAAAAHPHPHPQSTFSVQNLLLLSGLAALTFLFVDNADVALELIHANFLGSQIDESAGYRPAPHANSFGGENNVGHPGGAKAASQGIGVAFEDIVIPVGNFGQASRSLNAENIVNLLGHYMHDEHRSPYGSHLYDKPKEFLDEEQAKYEEKMDRVREEWGAWSFQDPRPERPVANFDDVDYKDLPTDRFPQGCWQTDEAYVKEFIREARGLVDRVQEGIYAEYGSPLNKTDGTTLAEEGKAERARQWGPKIIAAEGVGGDVPNKDDPNGIATLSHVAFDGLVRKLLHALIANDDWYAVLGGHSAAAGHGNQFQQNKQITFHHLMEPVFDKLGVRLVSRNMGQGGVGTLQFSIGGKDLYGEADIMEWDSAMTEKGNTVDLWNKQAILSGERVPVILSPFHFNVMDETNGTALMGNLMVDAPMVPPTPDDDPDDPEQAQALPWATRHLDGRAEKYNAICWEARSDLTPVENQDAHPGSQVGWHPGWRYHQFQGRKVALILLKGLAAALDRWEAGIEADGFPLAEHYWHVGDLYNTIRENLRTHVNTPNEVEVEGGETTDLRSPCEHAFPYLPRVCRVAMHGYGMWEPRAHNSYDLLNIIEPAPNGYKPHWVEGNWYAGFDVLPFVQRIPDGEVDPHAIAIATTFPAPDLDHDWIEDEDSGGGTNSTPAANEPPTRRWLREATRRAFHNQPTVIDVGSLELAQRRAKSKSQQRRRLGDDSEAITPGRGWVSHAWRPDEGFCDGSPQSECNRAEHNKCMSIGHNDNHRDVAGNTLAGWLVFSVPNVKEGIVMARMEWWCGGSELLTKGWSEVNNGQTMDTMPWNVTEPWSQLATRRLMAGKEEHPMHPDDYDYHRRLGKPTHDELVKEDFKMDIAINGKITKTMEREEWLSHTGTFGVELCDLRSLVFSFIPTYYVDKSCSSPNLSFSSFIRRNEQELRPFPPHGRHQLRRTRLGRGGRG